MLHPNKLLEKLARSSSRLNKSLIVLGALLLLLLGTSYVGVMRMIDEQRDTLQFHFARLMENIREQEAFLLSITQESIKGASLPTTTLPYIQTPLLEEGPNIFEGRSLPPSLPYSLKINPKKIQSNQHRKLFTIGAYLSAYYSAFWSASHYQSPQVILIDRENSFDLTIPAAGRLRGTETSKIGQLVDAMIQIRKRADFQSVETSTSQVAWSPYENSQNNTWKPALLAYISIDLGKNGIDIEGADTQALIGSTISLSQVNNIERLMQWSIYDDFTLISPTGKILTGSKIIDNGLNEGVNINSHGLVFKLTSPGNNHWTAIYVITFKSFLDYALWPLLILVTLVLILLICSRAVNRWYHERVILPAQSAHAYIVESEAFSRTVIDTAPIGLCVIRRSDYCILLENQRAQEWHDKSQLKELLAYHHEDGHTELEMNKRHLNIAFVCTRYRGQDAWLCASNDVTRHVEDAVALEDARKAADAANQAKSRFLATISHEIRTPLYGVLGTLELLGLTELSMRQQDYLSTIKSSSGVLFKLISDVLDISKIEAGQMTIDYQNFCPLDITEETARTYSALASSKGLQLYTCIDATLANHLRGDPLRIRQILNNLLGNAIKFTNNGKIVLRVRASENIDGRQTAIWQVSDSGIGISKAQQKQLFDPFYQASNTMRQAGAGLGLAISKWLSELMGGELSVVSEIGVGSSFTLQLPLECTQGALSDYPVFPPDTPSIYVRAHCTERAHHLAAWLNRFGLDCHLYKADFVSTSSLLVELAHAPLTPTWPGPKIVATINGPIPAQMRNNYLEVDANNVRAIAWAVHRLLIDENNGIPQLASTQPSHLKLRILVAEDNTINSAVIREQLEVLGCSVVIASDGEQALETWAHGSFDLVLTDINMPVMNGYQLAVELRKLDKKIPIIGFTANALREEGEHCIAAGMNTWMAKPLDLATLRNNLEKFVKPNGSLIQNIPLTLSTQMRKLFTTTMSQDIHSTLIALDSGDLDRVKQQLHSMAGALGAVQLETMAKELIDLETRLTSMTVNLSIDQEIRQSLAKISDLLSSLQQYLSGPLP